MKKLFEDMMKDFSEGNPFQMTEQEVKERSIRDCAATLPEPPKPVIAEVREYRKGNGDESVFIDVNEWNEERGEYKKKWELFDCTVEAAVKFLSRSKLNVEKVVWVDNTEDLKNPSTRTFCTLGHTF